MLLNCFSDVIDSSLDAIIIVQTVEANQQSSNTSVSWLPRTPLQQPTASVVLRSASSFEGLYLSNVATSLC